jgi:hypothetical protein
MALRPVEHVGLSNWGTSAFHEAEMNEQDWLRCDDSLPMLEFIRENLSDPFEDASAKTDSQNEEALGFLSWKAAQRKLRLFACACVRRTEKFGGLDELDAIEASEKYADGLVDKATLEDVFARLRKRPEAIPYDADMALSVFGPTDMAWETRLIDLLFCLGPELDVRAVATKAAAIVTERAGAESVSRRGKSERNQQAHLLRDIFGNPFRPTTLDPSCFNDTTRSVAKTIYEEGRFADLSRLARALKKDAGCANPDLREHCRWPIRHVRGCWVVDLVHLAWRAPVSSAFQGQAPSNIDCS